MTIPVTGIVEHVYSLPADPAFVGLTLSLQSVLYAGPTGSAFSLACPSLTLVN